MTDERWVENGDVRLRVEVTGSGPPIVCVHGWPEVAHSWRHQVDHFAGQGHQVVAIDVRGSGGSSAPAAIERYTLRELAGDVAAVVDSLDGGPAVLFGHDWGAPIAWHTAIRHPDQVRAVAGLSVPHSPPMPMSLLDIFDQLYPEQFFYMLHFREPDRMEAELAADLRAGLKKVYWALSGLAPAGSFLPSAPRGADFLPLLPEPPAGPLEFLPDADLDRCVSALARSGMTGGLNRYRALALDAAANDDIVGATVAQPSCFVGGGFDAVRSMLPGADLFADPGSGCTDFRGSTIVEGVGHWVQQEAPEATNAALEAFLEQL